MPYLSKMGMLSPQETHQFAVYSTDDLDLPRIKYQGKIPLLPVGKISTIPRVINAGKSKAENLVSLILDEIRYFQEDSTLHRVHQVTGE